jgi:hypothetical protein
MGNIPNAAAEGLENNEDVQQSKEDCTLNNDEIGKHAEMCTHVNGETAVTCF